MSASKAKILVFDAWSILAYLEGEPPGRAMAGLIAEAHESGIPLLMTVVNLGEVWYILARKSSEREADRVIRDLKQLGIKFLDVDWNLAHGAAKFKSKSRMSFGDCFAAAAAKFQKADLVTGDPDFKQVENEIGIVWLER